MPLIAPPLNINASLLKARASRHSVIGAVIAIVAVLVATALSAYLGTGSITIASVVAAQRTNPVLWVLDLMPFVFAVWGQYIGAMISDEASAMVQHQTSELRAYTAAIEKKAAHEATHDSLTGLPNRTLFIDRLHQATTSARREGSRFAVLILDLDRFKEVNDTLGHFNGDRLIRQVGLRLSGVVRESDTIARIGGDEFGFLLLKSGRRPELTAVARRINQSLKPAFALEKLSLDVRASIGAVMFPDHGRDVDTLIQRADVAMYTAKQDNAGFSLYEPSMDDHSPHRLTLTGELREAIQQDDLILYYQPKVFGASNQLYAVEALVRWQHRKHGFMAPDDFIPLAERTGLIPELTVWVLKKALEECAQWHRSGLKIGVAVNISSLCLLDPEFPEVLTGLLASYDFPARSLTMEITETSIMVDPDRSLAIIKRIHDMGVSLSIDDFGTGYSSLSYLKRLPVSELKIDKSFVLDMLSNDSDSTIVNATIQLGHNLGLKVVAEGVENAETYAALKAMGCDVLQGYFISRPVPSAEFLRWAEDTNGRA